MEEMIPFIIAGCLIGGDILLLKLGLTITKAEDKTTFKWVAGSFGIQFGLIFFISLPLLLSGFMGAYQSGGPPPVIIALTIIFSAFIDLHIINVLHKIGMKRALIIVILIIGPLSWAMYLINFNIGMIISKYLIFP